MAMEIGFFQDFLENECSSACRDADISKLRGREVTFLRQSPARLQLIVDVESSLHKFYGGYYSDWVCGGQWKRMLVYLNELIRFSASHNVELIFFVHGAAEMSQLRTWCRHQLEVKSNTKQVMRHVSYKATPPPKVIWVAPTCLRMCLRMAIRHLGAKVCTSVNDHVQEVIRFCYEAKAAGVIADKAQYAIFNPPHYYSAKALKMRKQGFDTTEYVIEEVAKSINLDPNCLSLMAALMGNHILTEYDLREFYFKICPSCMNDKKILLQKIIKFVRELPQAQDWDVIAECVFGFRDGPVVEKFKDSVQYYMSGTCQGYNSQMAAQDMTAPGAYRQAGVVAMARTAPAGSSHDPTRPDVISTALQSLEVSGRSCSGDAGGLVSTVVASWSVGSSDPNAQKNMGSNNPDEERRLQALTVHPELLVIANRQHRSGAMSPWIYQILSCGEVKLDCVLQDENSNDLPPVHLLYKPVRQLIYGILFDVVHKAKEAREQQKTPAACDSVMMREWSVPLGSGPEAMSELVAALPLSWDVPSLHELWMGPGMEMMADRMRALLSCFLCDIPEMHPSNVPHKYVILCCVLRFLLTNEPFCVLRRHELDACLATAVAAECLDPVEIQESQLPMVTCRGVQLATILMHGVEMAILANDVCGVPLPWQQCCPWLFFDGKLLHRKLLEAENNMPLLELCDGKMEDVILVERLRSAVLADLDIDSAFQQVHDMGGSSNEIPSFGSPYPPGYHEDVQFRPAGAPPMQVGGGGKKVRMPQKGNIGDGRGGHLEVAGVTVADWGSNVSHRPRFHGAGRGMHVSTQPPHATGVGPIPRPMGLNGMGDHVMTSYPEFPPQGRHMGRGHILYRPSGQSQWHGPNMPPPPHESMQPRFGPRGPGPRFRGATLQGPNVRQSGPYFHAESMGPRNMPNFPMHPPVFRQLQPHQPSRPDVQRSVSAPNGRSQPTRKQKSGKGRGKGRGQRREGGKGRVQYMSVSGEQDRTQRALKLTLEEQMKAGGGRGRGCTVERLSDGQGVVMVSQIIEGLDLIQIPPENCDAYEDADEDSDGEDFVESSNVSQKTSPDSDAVTVEGT